MQSRSTAASLTYSPQNLNTGASDEKSAPPDRASGVDSETPKGPRNVSAAGQPSEDGRLLSATKNRRQIKRMPLQALQAELRAISGTPFKDGIDRMRRYFLWRQLDRVVRHRESKQT